MASTVSTLDAEIPASEQDSVFKWSHQAVLLLIEEYRRREEDVISGKMSQKRVWELISGILRSHGHDVTGPQCQSKFHGMKRTFKSIKNHNSKSGNNPRSWLYTEVMESLLGEKPFMNPVALASSSTSSQACTEIEDSDVSSLDNSDISVDSGSSRSRKRKTSHTYIAEAILESRQIAEENKQKRHQQTMDQRAKVLNALHKLIDELQSRSLLTIVDPAPQRIAILNGIAPTLMELIDLTPSSESEEDELEHVMHMMERKKLPRLENYVENIVPAYNDQQFKSHFRISRGTFEFILAIIAPRLKRTHAGLSMISPEKQFLIAICRMATPASYRSICEKFDVSRATALSATRRVVRALYNLAPTVIRWPSGNNVNEVWTGFEAISGFPKVIGAIAGTHINILAPRVQPASYVNSKGHHSVQLQAVCNHKAHFTHCFAEYTGSVHDQRVFRLSELQKWLGDPEKFPDDCHILGDAAYKLHQNVIVPYRDNGHLTPRQKNFNFCHSSARIAIERAFGLLKTRFRSIRTVLAMARCDLVPIFIIACCTMHNICLSRGDEVDLDASNETEDNIYLHEDAAPLEQIGVAKRDLICERLLMRNV